MAFSYYFALISLFSCASLTAQATDPALRFGFSGSLSGHFGSYGIMISRGIQAAFKGHACSIDGKKEHAELVCMDDRGDAAKTKSNISIMRKNGIHSFVGVMGSRGVLSVLPLIEQQKIAVFFPWGADSKFKNQKLSNIINALGLIEPQIDHLVHSIIEEKKLEGIAIFHADDSFSTKATTYCAEQLAKHGAQPLLITHYNRYTLDLSKGLSALCNADPRVIICISTGMPAVKIINLLFRKGFYGCTFFGIDSTFLIPEILATKGVPFSYSASVPDPITSTISLAQQYRDDLEKFYPDEKPTILSFAYYICGRLIIDAISQRQSLDKQIIMQALESMENYNFHGFPVHFNPQNRYLFGQKTWLLES